MAQNRVVQGFFVNSFTVKKESIKVVLKGVKDDIRAGDGDVGDVLKSLELHSTAGEEAPIKVALLLGDKWYNPEDHPALACDRLRTRIGAP